MRASAPPSRHLPRLAWLVLFAGPLPAAAPALGQPPTAPAAAQAAEAQAADAPAEAETAGAPAAAESAQAQAETAPQSPDTDPGLPVSRFESELAFDRLLAVEDYDAAVGVGERMVQLTIEEFGAESIETGNAYARLGAAQREAGDLGAAEENYLRAVEIMRQAGGPYSRQLVDPLVGLGDTYHADEQYLNAVSAYNEARSVNRRVYGLLNEEQIPILDRMTESFFAMEELQRAEEQQLAALRLIERVYEPYSPERLEAVYKYGDWLRRSNRFSAERQQYVRAIQTIREHYGEDDVRLVEPLRRLGNSFRLQRAAHDQGIGALNDALEILTAQSDPDPLALATVLRDIGDWRTAFSKVGSDNAEYRQAWQALGRVDDGERLRQEWFSGIHYVLREPHSSRGLSRDADAVQGSVTVRLDIDEHGHSENVGVFESDPPGFKNEAFVRHVRLSRFRPHMADGEVVPARRLGLRFTFMYLPDELEDG